MIYTEQMLACIERAERIGAATVSEALDLVRMLLLEEIVADEEKSQDRRARRLARYSSELDALRARNGWGDDLPIPCPNCAQGELTDHGVCVECGRVTP